MRNIPLITATVVSLVAAMVLFVLGAYEAVITPVPWWMLLSAIGVLGLVTWRSGLVRQTLIAKQDVQRWR